MRPLLVHQPTAYRNWRATIAAACVSILASYGASLPAMAQEENPTLRGSATAQTGSVLLPGVLIVIRDSNGQVAVSAISDGEGQFQVWDLTPGTYELTATLDGFDPVVQIIQVEPLDTIELDLEFEISRLAETVQVVSPVSVEFTDITAPVASRETFDSAFIEQSPTSDDSIEAALPLLPGVIRGPDGINIKGGRPTQSSLQLGGAYIVDPATGNTPFTLPSSGVESVEVLPNPYAVEFGRFTSGVTVIEPKRGGDTWEVAVNNPVPAFQTRRGQPLDLTGIRGFSPSFTIAGPLIPGRLFLAQSAQYRYSNDDVRSRPESDRRTQESLNAFTRLDAVLPRGHRLAATIGLFPQELSGVGLDTFNPPEVTPNLSRGTYHIAVTDTAALSTLTLLETTLQFTRHNERVSGQFPGVMELLPDENRGTFFNTQERRSTGIQWLGSWSGLHQSPIGENFFKVGADVLHVRFDGESQSAPVNIRRLDGTLARQIVFDESPRRTHNSTDLALYAQDRWRLNDRLLVEFGLRLDRDGVLQRSHLTPRLGAAVNLNQDGTMAIRGGIGLFYERTPSAVQTFDQFERRTVTDFAADGRTPVGLIRYQPTRAEDLNTARSRTWHVEYRHQVTPDLVLAAEHLERTGTQELIVERSPGAPTAQLRLSSRGRSRYHETGVSATYTRGAAFDLDVTYVTATSSADLNAFTAFFNTVQDPLIRTNEFARTGADVPHRLVARTRIVLDEKWRFVPLLEVRSGFPYTAVDEHREFVEPRSSRRFPTVARFDIAAERQFAIAKWRPWIGVRILNMLNRFEPRDVQNSLESLRFGEFFNSDPIQARVTVRLQL